MSNMYEMFGTDTDSEKSGIYIDYGQFRIKIARAGGANQRFAKAIEAKTKPYRRAIATETMDNSIADRIMKEVYVDTVIRGWEVKNEEDQWIVGLHGKDGDVVKDSRDNILAALEALPDLFSDIQQQAGTASLYRQQELEDDSGN